MSMELRELYQELIIEHNRNPHHHYAMTDATCKANGFNPLCGDKLTLYLKISDEQIDEVSFIGRGCAISQASASMMTDILRGKTIAEARQLFERFHALLTHDTGGIGLPWTGLRFLPVSRPIRHGSSAQPWPGIPCIRP